MSQSFGMNDVILFVSLTYSVFDLQVDWELFDSCARPVHHWLLVSYASVLAFRVTHILGVRTAGTPAGGANFLLDLRQKGTVPRLLAAILWFVALPFFVLWTGIGTFWLSEVMSSTPECIPSSMHFVFCCLWLVLSYGWIIIHLGLAGVAFTLERRVQRAEADLSEIADPETISRWGEVGQLSDFTSLGAKQNGLSPAEIRALPSSVALCDNDSAHASGCCAGGELECSICLNSLAPGDSIRHLPACGHSFHRSCIDLWLLRSADCPLCKRCVRGEESA